MPLFLQDLFAVKESGEDVLLAPDSEEEHLPVDHRWEANVAMSNGDLRHSFIKQNWNKTNHYEYFSTKMKIKKTNNWIQMSNLLVWISFPS